VFPDGDLDGLAFVRAVRRRSVPAHPLIIVVSGFTQKTDEYAAHDAGADLFLIKPCLPEQLLREIQRAYETRGRWTAGVSDRYDAS
jgi:DNA-binding response OmpR family regulator